MYKIELPTINWFLFNNVFTGSLRTELTKGCLSQTTFNYKVQMLENRDEKMLTAICYYTLPWNQCANMDEAVIGRFEANNFGIEVCENWISSKFITKYPPQIDDCTSMKLCTENGTLEIV